MRGLVQPMSANLLESFVFCKPYFDRHGLIVAADDDRPVGFVHAGFGPDEDQSSLCTQLGVTCLLMTQPHPERDRIARELLACSEKYLRARGSEVLYGGGIRPLDPFYHGLYGGSELPGILASDAQSQEVFRKGGYKEIDRCIVLQRELPGFRPPVDRRQMLIRRRFNVESTFDPLGRTWWEACTVGQLERTQFDLVSRDGGPPRGRAVLWTLEPLASSWGVHAVGLSALEIDESERRQGLATFLLGEALRQVHGHGATLVEAQAMQHNTAALSLYHKLGFGEVDQGIVFRKET
jgi:GNAT superfamily N-acetyltransferase